MSDHGQNVDSEKAAVLEPELILEAPTTEVIISPQLTRKIDLRVVPCLALLYLISFVDRNSLANASILGYKTDLHLKADQYNLIATGFFLTYAIFEVPSQIIIQSVRPSLWLAILTAAWGLVTLLSAFPHDFGGAFATRFFLGITEAGFFPAALQIVGTWYPRKDLQKRVAGFYATGILAGSFTGLLAYAITYMDGIAGLASWRWLFLLEASRHRILGIATILLSLLIYFGIPDSPESARWLTASEKEVVMAIRAQAGAGHLEKEDFRWVHMKQAVTDIRILLCVWLCICCNIAVIGFSYVLPTVLTELGYSAAKAQLMTVPIYAVACLCVCIAAYFNDRYERRALGIFCGFLVGMIGLIALYALPKDRNPNVRYFFCIWVCAGLYAAYPALLAWCSNNAAGRGKKNMATTFQCLTAGLATAIGTNVYLTRQAQVSFSLGEISSLTDRPYYHLGYGMGIAICASALVATVINYLVLRRDNARKAAMNVGAYTPEQLEEMGDKAPTFIYIL